MQYLRHKSLQIFHLHNDTHLSTICVALAADHAAVGQLAMTHVHQIHGECPTQELSERDDNGSIYMVRAAQGYNTGPSHTEGAGARSSELGSPIR